MQVLVIILMFGIFGGIIAWALWYQKRQTEKAWANFVEFGQTFGITVMQPKLGWFFSPMPIMQGDYKGRRMHLHTERRRSGKHTYYYTILTMYAPGSNNFSFRLLKEGFFQKIGKMLGGQDIQTGDATFDKVFMLKSNSPEIALQVFDMQLCGKILDHQGWINSSLDLNNGALVYSEQVHLTNAKHIERFVNIAHLNMAILDKVQSKLGSRPSRPQ